MTPINAYGLPVLRFLCLTPGLNELCRCCVRIGRAADCGDDEEPLDARGLESGQVCCLHAAANHDRPRADLMQGAQVVEILLPSEVRPASFLVAVSCRGPTPR